MLKNLPAPHPLPSLSHSLPPFAAVAAVILVTGCISAAAAAAASLSNHKTSETNVGEWLLKHHFR